MPCRDWDDVSEADCRRMDEDNETRKQFKKLENKIVDQKTQIDKLTLFLCTLCDHIGEDELEGDLLDWYNKHKTGDSKEQERIRKMQVLKQQLETRITNLNKELKEETKEILYKASLIKETK